MMFILKANKHFDGYDIQVELDSYPTRLEAESEADRLAGESYVHDEGEMRRATYVIVEDRTNDTVRASETVDGDGTEVVKAGIENSGNSKPKRASPNTSKRSGNRA